MSAANDNQREGVRYAYALACTGCGQQVFCAVHYGRPDHCLSCQTFGPENHREFLRITGQMTERKA